jgi:glycosyltransferase involved in cell wall biosynthesis
MKKNKNILEVCFSPDLGGLELYMQNCAKDLSNDFNVLSVINCNSKLRNYFDNTIYKSVQLNRKSSFSLKTIWKLSKLIDEHKTDIIHFHWTKDLPIIVFAKLLSKQKPKIIQTRHMTMTRFKNDFYHKFLYKNVDTIICVTKELENQIQKFISPNIRPKTEVLYLGVKNVDSFEKEELEKIKEDIKVENSFMIGFVGRINESKGQYLLIEAMKELIEQGLNIKAYFVGSAMDESYLDLLKQKVKDYKLEEKVFFLGFINEPNKFMQSCDLIVAASKNETFGLVVIEAMNNKTAVIASKNGGFLEIIDDEKNGLLFENQNPKDLASKIEILYKNNDYKNLIALNGKQKVDEMFNHKIQFEKLKNQLLN